MSEIEIGETAPEGWRELVDRAGMFYHEPAWINGIGTCYGYPVRYLSCREGARLTGGIALAAVPSLFGARRLVSFPFSYAAGFLGGSPEERRMLADAAGKVAATFRARRLELKEPDGSSAPPPGFERRTHYASYRVDTSGGEQAVWKRLHAGSTQRSIKKGEKAGVEAVAGTTEDDWLTMARLEERTARTHGVPPPPRQFFLGLCRELQRQGLAALLLARVPTGEIAAGIVLWKGRSSWIYAFGASVPALLATRPNHVLLWRAMRDAIGAGVTFDLGRAAPEQHGLVEFKSRWGGVPVPLAYDYWPSAAGLNVAPRDRGVLALGAAVWSHLPMTVTRWGSRLYRYLG